MIIRMIKIIKEKESSVLRQSTIYRLIMENSIEEKIIALHKDKRDLADSILEGSDTSARISTEELLNLLKEG